MPAIDDQELKKLIENGDVTALSIDATVFHSLCRSGNLDNPIFRQLENLSALGLDFLLSEVVLREAQRHFEEVRRETAQSLKKAMRSYSTAWKENRDFIEALQNDERLAKTPGQAVDQTINHLLSNFKPEVLDFGSGIDITQLLENYFAGRRPFTATDKKAQFPDAVALAGLDAWSKLNGAVLVVSNDGEWKSFCEESERLFVVSALQQALELIKEARPKPIPHKNLLVMFMSDLALGPQGQAASTIRAAVERSLEDYPYADASSPFSLDAELDEISIQHLVLPENNDELQILSLNETSILFVITVTAEIDASAQFSFFTKEDGEETVFATRNATRSLTHDFQVSIELKDNGGESYDIHGVEVVPDTALTRVKFDDQNPFDEELWQREW